MSFPQFWFDLQKPSWDFNFSHIFEIPSSIVNLLDKNNFAQFPKEFLWWFLRELNFRLGIQTMVQIWPLIKIFYISYQNYKLSQ